jgi:outer membrane protein
LEKNKASQEVVVSTSESFKYAQERYEIGKSSVFEFNEAWAKIKMLRSWLEEAQAKYNYIFCTKILDFYIGVPQSSAKIVKKTGMKIKKISEKLWE